jgi:hypothetical protein
VFGTLKPACSRHLPDKASYDRAYCGLCHSLGEYGTIYRGVLSYDAVFMALLVEGLQEKPALFSSCRCPLVPVVHRPTLALGSVSMQAAAAIQLLLGDQWLADRSVERPGLLRVRGLVSGAVEKARAELEKLGVATEALVGVEERQLAVEQREAGPCAAAEPTEATLGALFGELAGLPGSAAVEKSLLERLGRALGATIYHRDALEDLEKDFLKGEFNPCIRGKKLDNERVEEAKAALSRALEELELLDQLPLKRNRELLLEIKASVVAASKKALLQANRVVKQRALLEARAKLPYLVRLYIALQVWLHSSRQNVDWKARVNAGWSDIRMVLARPRPLSGYLVLPLLLPLVFFLGISRAYAADERKKTGCEPVDSCAEAVGEICQTFAELCKAFGELCNVCKDCGNACQGCGECGNICQDCGNTCQGCGQGCNDCGNSCQGCGQGCNNCGQGCQGCNNCHGCQGCCH